MPLLPVPDSGFLNGLDRNAIVGRVEEKIRHRTATLHLSPDSDWAEVITDGVLAVLEELGAQARQGQLDAILIPAPKPSDEVDYGLPY